MTSGHYVCVCVWVCVCEHACVNVLERGLETKTPVLIKYSEKKKNTVFACLDPQIYFWFVCHFWWQKFRLYDFGTDFDTPVAWYCTYELRDIVYEQIYKQRFANKGPSTQSFGFSSSHVWMWELDCKESWVLKNWCFWTMVLEKTLESPLDCKEIQPVHPKGNQSWIFIGRTDAEAETPVLWPLDGKNWLIWKDPDAGNDWRQDEKGMTVDEMVGWHHWLNGHKFE